MQIRSAKTSDAKAINSLINYYAEQDKMLFRSVASVYEELQSFLVAEIDDKIVGCCCLQIVWADLAEVKSLAVEEKRVGTGVGRGLVLAIAEKAQELGISRLFALTLNAEFFKKAGFKVIEKEKLPMKVWTDCAKCPKQRNCDEIAVIKELK